MIYIIIVIIIVIIRITIVTGLIAVIIMFITTANIIIYQMTSLYVLSNYLPIYSSLLFFVFINFLQIIHIKDSSPLCYILLIMTLLFAIHSQKFPDISKNSVLLISDLGELRVFVYVICHVCHRSYVFEWCNFFIGEDLY